MKKLSLAILFILLLLHLSCSTDEIIVEQPTNENLYFPPLNS